jgi:hypothetical protein
LLAVGAPPAAILLAGGLASADCNTIGLPTPDFAQARGTTFIAVSQERRIYPESRVARYTLEVTRVYAGDIAPGEWRYRADACSSVGFEPGVRYLVTTADIQGPDVTDTLTWRLNDDGSVRLEPQYMRYREYPAETRRARTVHDVLDGLGVGSLPDTSVTSSNEPAWGPAWPLALVTGAGAALVLLRYRREPHAM